MEIPRFHIFKRPDQLISGQHIREFSSGITRINVFRARLLSVACILWGAFLLMVDWNMIRAKNLTGLFPMYLWTDAILVGLGALFLLLFFWAGRCRDRTQRPEQVLVQLCSLLFIAWCGGVGALEYYTHNSVSTLVIGALILPAALFLSSRTVFLSYGLGLALFLILKSTLGPAPLNFWVEHINLVAASCFGWLLSRIFYMNRVENFLNQQKIIEKNAQLAHEITERKTIEKELEQRVRARTQELSDLNAALKNEIQEREQAQIKLDHAQKMEVIGTMASGIAHDLNNVLSGINTYPEMLLMDLKPGHPMRAPLEIIRQSGQKAADIIQDMLTLARRGVPIKSIVNLNEVIREYQGSFEFKKLGQAHPDVSVTTRLSPDSPLIKGSAIHLSTTLMNMITNAAESMPHGGQITISTRVRTLDTPIKKFPQFRKGAYVILEITDTGIGIPKQDLERIFEPFYTNKPMGKSGTGLGMALVLGTVKDHKGHIEVNSRVNHGTRFTLYFPVSQAAVADKPKREIRLPGPMGSGETILVVDDLKEQLFIASSILQKYNYAVHCTQGGEKAVEYMAQGGRADLVVLDMNMEPGISGLETFRRMRKIHPGQKAIIASGFLGESILQEAAACGITTYVHKPYTLQAISAAVAKELAKP